MGIGINLICENCSWKSNTFLIGVGRNFYEGVLCKKIETSTDPELAGARQALAEHSNASVSGVYDIFQCPLCRRIERKINYSIIPNEVLYPQTDASGQLTWPKPKPPYWTYHPHCSNPSCAGRMSYDHLKCPKCDGPLSFEYPGTMWD